VDAEGASDEGAGRGRRSRVVLTPRRRRQACGRYPAGDGGKKARSPGRARSKPLKPLRAGMPGDSGVTAVNTRVHLPLLCAHEAAGALGARHSPRPLLTVAPRLWAAVPGIARAHRAARRRGMFAVVRLLGARGRATAVQAGRLSLPASPSAKADGPVFQGVSFSMVRSGILDRPVPVRNCAQGRATTVERVAPAEKPLFRPPHRQPLPVVSA
jgi:hypothetical protein